MAANNSTPPDSPSVGETIANEAGKAKAELRKGAEEIGASLDAANGDISADLQRLREDLSRLSETVSGIAGERGAAAASRVTDGVRSVKESVYTTANDAYSAGADIASSAKTHAGDFASDVEDTVRRNPIGTVLAALGVGLIVGMMSRGR
ncbi:DUF883 family protein [Chelatococcus reniformis]|uniref:DUF883 domain-containing protein n=1 Tax=Chelatococcus reniformis TaxID=1494448 RepID=A0A916U752_9HYPH|nr:hypothetical protein [Chelatococcus reniformis]GGC62263.1 hypothetical protein GCM10010994_21060 [Chelatococcus reniformis]